MSQFEIFQFPYMSDNYGVILHDAESGETIAIDAGDAGAYLGALKEKGWKLSHLLVTHHHSDHVAGLMEIKNATGCRVIGPKQHSAAIEGLDQQVWDGDKLEIAGRTIRVLATPGHTTDMINFYFEADKLVFTGDTLFALGCGRMFEGNAKMMWDSLQKLMALPHETIIYCSHEYTLANATFAVSVDADNKQLLARKLEIENMRAAGTPTIPTLLATELQTNPFLRPSDPSIRRTLQMGHASDQEVFAEIRKRKDNF